MTSLNRNVFVINLDPANENLTYDCEINIYELINVEDVMRNCNLGPNGGLLFAIEFLEENFEWLEFKLNNLSKKYSNAYFLFDFPGQIDRRIVLNNRSRATASACQPSPRNAH